MKQFQFYYRTDDSLKSELQKIKQWCKNKVTSGVVFQILSETLDSSKIEGVCALIAQNMPNAIYYGCSTNGNICEGSFTGEAIAITCTVFEYPSTKTALLQYEISDETAVAVTEQLKAYISQNPWVKSVEMLVTIRGMSMTGLCEALSAVRDDIVIYGGGAFSSDISVDTACVFSKQKGISHNGIVFLLTGGEDYYVTASFITGWKPLGRKFKVTKSVGSVLYELDNEPAYNAYYRYLNIKNDDNFFMNTLEFPLIYDYNEIELLRAPVSCNKDGSLRMTSNVEQGVMAKIAYGDPWTILDSVNTYTENIYRFHPNAIKVFSCAARRTYWGDEEVSRETIPFERIASTSGFFTSGEFLRTKGYVNQHNVTLVVTAQREGAATEQEDSAYEPADKRFSGKVSMINRLATFIEAATTELSEANAKLERVAISDGLTGLLNRKEIQTRIDTAIKTDKNVTSLIMLDIDNFKSVNDTYGHSEGDNVIIALSNILKKVVEYRKPYDDSGRWGGEEFMLLLRDCDIKLAAEIAEKIRAEFEQLTFELAGKQTISVGVTQAVKGESTDELCNRVDNALYDAKRTGKNKVVIV